MVVRRFREGRESTRQRPIQFEKRPSFGDVARWKAAVKRVLDLEKLGAQRLEAQSQLTEEELEELAEYGKNADTDFDAAEVLGNLKDPRGIVHLREIAKSSEQGVRYKAAEALGKIIHEDALYALGELSNDPEPFVRMTVIKSLGELLDSELVDSESVRQDFLQILSELIGMESLDPFNFKDVFPVLAKMFRSGHEASLGRMGGILERAFSMTSGRRPYFGPRGIRPEDLREMFQTFADIDEVVAVEKALDLCRTPESVDSVRHMVVDSPRLVQVLIDKRANAVPAEKENIDALLSGFVDTAFESTDSARLKQVLGALGAAKEAGGLGDFRYDPVNVPPRFSVEDTSVWDISKVLRGLTAHLLTLT